MNQSIRTVPDFSICQFAFGNLFFFCWLTSELIYSSVISVHDRPCLSIWTFVRLSITKKKNRQSRMIVYGPPFWTIVTPPPLRNPERARRREDPTYFLCHWTTGSAITSRMSTLRASALKSGCFCTNSHPTCAKKNPRDELYGSASVSVHLWWTRWSRTHWNTLNW